MSAAGIARAAVLLALAVLLAACVGAPVRPSAPASGQTGDHVLEARRAALREWTLAGRIAVANAGKGGSGRIDWRQQGAAYTLALSAPVTRQSWTLSGDAGGARIDGLEGGPRTGADVQALLLQVTGWQVPFQALASWVRAIAADPARYGRADVDYGSDGQPLRIVQGGWTIGYQWPATGQAGTDPVLPVRVEAVNGQARVRLIVDQWQLPSGPTAP
ncbi:MAG: lipoprotein insertase outer membrane protein LolB [Pseudoxanthomonas sp.]